MLFRSPFQAPCPLLRSSTAWDKGESTFRADFRRAPRVEREAFTLLELLTVIGIVVLLGALLWPALRRSKQGAETAKCLSNLHQIGLAVQTYVAENEGKLPVLQNRDSVTNAAPALDTVFFPGPRPSRVFQCPADRKGLFEATGNSYFWNFTVNGQDIGGLASMVGGGDPSRIPLVSDKEGFHPDVKDRVNVLYADGRASKELRFSTSPP